VRCVLLAVLLGLFAFPAWAVSAEDGLLLTPALDHLCQDVLDGADVDPTRVAALLEHVRLHPRASEAAFRYEDAPGAYQAFTLDQSLQALLRYLYNPSIPEEALKPFSIRSSRWVDEVPALRRLWQDPWPPASPVVLRGMQEDQTTPDQSTGGWYRMRLKRALILLPWGAGQAMVSVSVQQGPSEIGAKGYLAGPDADWSYLYTDDKGLTKTGLGWVESRILSNVSVAVYLAEPGQPVVNGIFQWMRAGWSGLSVVKTEHVRASLERYERELRRVLEAPGLPAPEVLEAWHAEIARHDSEALRRQWTWDGLVEPDAAVALPTTLRRAVEDGGYLAGLDDTAVRSMVLVRRVREAVAGGS
jgi:hypothetical protein